MVRREIYKNFKISTEKWKIHYSRYDLKIAKISESILVLSDESVGFIPYYSATGVVFRLVCKTAKSDYYFLHVSPSLRQSFRMEQLGSHWMDFHEIWNSSIFRKTVEKIQVWLESNKKTCTLLEDQYTFLIISRSLLLRMRNVSDKICRGNQNAHFVSSNLFSKIVQFLR
jgi:hypothetical protein